MDVGIFCKEPRFGINTEKGELSHYREEEMVADSQLMLYLLFWHFCLNPIFN